MAGLTVVGGAPSHDRGSCPNQCVAFVASWWQTQRNDVPGAARRSLQNQDGDVVVETDPGEGRMRTYLRHGVRHGRRGLVDSLEVHVAQPHRQLPGAETEHKTC